MVKSLVNTDMGTQEPPWRVMRSKTGWIIYREVDERPGSQKKDLGSHHISRGSQARMSGFTNDLTNFWGFPVLGAVIPNF